MTALRAAICAALLALAGPAAAATGERPTLMLYGDSLMAGYGLADHEGFAAELDRQLDAAGWDVRIVNASISGDTISGGLARMDWSLGEGVPDAVLVTLGGNDMLRGLPVARARADLAAIIARFQAEGVPVLLGGMMAQRNLGTDYVTQFDAIYPELAAQYGVTLYPFFLEGVALDPDLNQRDRTHPNYQGVQVIVRSILPYVIDLLEDAG